VIYIIKELSRLSFEFGMGKAEEIIDRWSAALEWGS